MATTKLGNAILDTMRHDFSDMGYAVTEGELLHVMVGIFTVLQENAATLVADVAMELGNNPDNQSMTEGTSQS